ncbi:hypothetical protein [Flavobacterium crassostreae]|uniref:DUF4304 domain-containing protein n=1 Tax=Flavobacterium crassostreae TaxID=1763534 RepID=A0A1B9DXJ9_9FLAO|nr:hypothetical protein [Flavobacterium crassostreae]OCB74407.1 hypothetical protein LPBF_10445 [Flavobacterium crassostreae]
MKFNEQIFNIFKSFFAEKGYPDSKYYEHNGALDYYRKDKNNIHWITITLDITKKAFVDVYGQISFLEVTNILQKFIEIRTNPFEKIVVNYYLYENREKWTDIWKALKAASPLKTKEDIEIFKQNISNHVDTYIVPFFEKIPDLQAVNDEILNKLSFEEYPNFISGNCTLKVLIIMKLCQNTKYEDYKQSKDKDYKMYVNQNPSMWQSSYDAFLSLTEYLDSGEYKKI